MIQFQTTYIAAGGNRYPAAGDWNEATGLLAYGSGRNIALWRPLNELTASNAFKTISLLEGHTGSINCIAVSPDRQSVVSGAADATIKVWRVLYVNHQWKTSLLQNICIRPKFIPLALALSPLETNNLLLAAAGTKGDIYVYATKNESILSHQATLSGHEGWIRSLAITSEEVGAHSDLLLASASQDKYIRLWRLSKRSDSIENNDEQTNGNIDFGGLLSNKTHTVDIGRKSYSISFEALLLGHDDWIYTISWQTIAGKPRLLSASADNSLAMWDSDVTSGLWTCTTRLGEISTQKGSTTATGSMGGFWIGLWSADGQSVVSLGRTGSWRLWKYDGDRRRWIQSIGISGHTKSVMDIAWAKNGSYLLSTGSDQTTRLHAGWSNGQQTSWQEFARPQIHGYDLNCIDTVGAIRFVSGADEKLLRVFKEPRGTAELLRKLCGIQNILEQELSEAANIPVLGLSNKAIEEISEIPGDQTVSMAEDNPSLHTGLVEMGPHVPLHPPTEDELAKHTLWPENEKLYGHGYEISAVAASHDGSTIATACKASSLDHAVIRLFETKGWRELKPPLTAHSLTVTTLRFAGDDQFLLSTGRDRQWAVFEKNLADPTIFELKAKHSKAHSRMILSACWAPSTAGKIIVTGGRDKSCKIWDLQKPEPQPANTINESAPVTAVDMLPHLVQGMLVLAVATETDIMATITRGKPQAPRRGASQWIM
ncbi:MAG: hypothetical protein Q9218_000850 [Villophora microphyllina]